MAVIRFDLVEQLICILLVLSSFHHHVLAARRSRSTQIACRDERNRAVDWFLAYKVPKLEKEPAPYRQGYGYVYITSSQSTGTLKNSATWTKAQYDVTESRSIFGATLNQGYERMKNDAPELSYIQYNDQPPCAMQSDCGSFSSSGHAKGVVMIDMASKSGVWLVHSVPAFPPPFNSTYLYPHTGDENGQTAICLSFKVDSENMPNKIANQLLYAKPYIYHYKLTEDLLKIAPLYQNLTNKRRSFKLSQNFNIDMMFSAGGIQMVSFAKSSKFAQDLWADLVAPQLEADILVETWRKGAGDPLKSDCTDKYKTENIEYMDIELKSAGNTDQLRWKFTEDHAKWGLTATSNLSVVCVGDINRMRSQYKRGGGTLCLKDPYAWSVFRNSVEGVEGCPRRGRMSDSTHFLKTTTTTTTEEPPVSSRATRRMNVPSRDSFSGIAKVVHSRIRTMLGLL